MKKQFAGLLSFLLIVSCLYSQSNLEYEGRFSSRLKILNDSLSRVQISIPKEPVISYDVTIRVNTQSEWNVLTDTIMERLKEGYRKIKVDIRVNKLSIGEVIQSLENLNYPDASILFDGHHVEIASVGQSFTIAEGSISQNGKFWEVPYSKYDNNDVIIDKNGIIISPLSNSYFITDEIEAVKEKGHHIYKNSDGTVYKELPEIWRFRVPLPDLSEDECRDFTILLTRDWTACRHQVQRVHKGYLYFYLNSEDAPTMMQRTLNPNKDRITYKKPPRCKFINCPVSDNIHTNNGKLYIPKRYNVIKICKVSQLFSIKRCCFRSVIFKGFFVNGCGASPVINIENSTFYDYAFIKDNKFKNISHNAIRIVNCKNVSFSNNIIENTRREAIKCVRSENVTINGNKLKNIGWMLSTRCISATGVKLHICDNDIEDFNYSAIECGGFRQQNEESLEFIVERNQIRYSNKYYNNHMSHSLSDAGGIYIHPENTGGIIRYNVVDHFIGNGANRGIFIDDGARNVAVYGNLVMDIGNSYDIDLRYTSSHKEIIPDHNTNNQIFYNIMTGGYRFQDTGEKNSRCYGGENLLLGTGDVQNNLVELKYFSPDYTLEGCKYKNGKVFIPKRYKAVLDSLRIDSFVRKHIYIR